MVKKLNPAQEKVRRLYTEGKLYEDIAKAVGITTNTVKYHAKILLRKGLVEPRRHTAGAAPKIVTASIETVTVREVTCPHCQTRIRLPM
jgi:DNA-binding MarR family transcriptional regulator